MCGNPNNNRPKYTHLEKKIDCWNNVQLLYFYTYLDRKAYNIGLIQELTKVSSVVPAMIFSILCVEPNQVKFMK